MKTAISIATAVALALTSMPATADNYVFRYKTSVSLNPSEGLGIGNDITVDFTGALGYPFSKVIPVSTKDVVVWKLDTGQFQPGLNLDPSTGIISGLASGGTTARVATLIGYDSSGRGIAQARITFRFQNPVGTPQEFTAYGHTGKYLYKAIPSSVQVSRWDSLTILPDGVQTQGVALSGAVVEPTDTDIAFIGYDYMGKEVAFASGDLIVEDGPAINEVADQSGTTLTTFEAAPHVQRAVGTLRYSLVALDGKPSGLSFDSLTGLLKGRIGTYGTTLRFQFKATDQDGTSGLSNVFSLSTADPDVDIANVKDLHAYVDTPYYRKLTAKQLSGTVNWEVIGGTLPQGLDLDADTGVISGSPVREETQAINIAVSTSDAGYAETGTFSFHVHALPIDVAFASKDVRIGTAFTTDAPSIGTGAIQPYSFAIANGSTVADGLTVDPSNATVSGSAATAGDYSVAFNFLNGDGNEKVFTQPITAYNPLSLAYDNVLAFHRRNGSEVAIPVVAENSIIGEARYAVTSGNLPPGMRLEADSGNFIGPATATGTWPNIAVTLSDASGDSVRSNVVSIAVVDRPAVEVSAKAVAVQRYVDTYLKIAEAANTYDGATYELSAGILPKGLSLSKGGYLTGSTTDAEGVYSGFKIKATDGEGYSGETAEFSITLIAPTALEDLANSAMAASWTEGVAFAFTLPRPSNAYGPMRYELTGMPDNVSASGNTISGQIDIIGAYSMPLVMTDDTGRSLSSTYTINILPPMSVELSGSALTQSPMKVAKSTAKAIAPAAFDLPRDAQSTITPAVSNGIEPISYAFTGKLPTGMTFTGDRIDGTPSVYGESAVSSVTVTDAAGTSVTIPVTLNVIDRLPVEVSYSISSPAAYINRRFGPINPTVKYALGTVTYEIQGRLPDGVVFNTSTGAISGIPKVDGRFRGIIVTATDSEGGTYAGSTDPFELGVSRLGLVGLATITNYTVRAGTPFLRVLKPTNVTAPLVFREADGNDMPYGLTLNPIDGTITGEFPNEGTYVARVTVTDDFGRLRTTRVQFAVVSALSISAPTVVSFNQYAAVSQPAPAKNVIGSVYYTLASGTLPTGLSLDGKTGRIVGTASTKGTWSNIVVRVTDSTGSTAGTPAFSLAVTDRLPLTLGAATSYSAFVNLPYKLTLPVSNAIGAVAFVQTGTLPAGLVFNASKGEISGTPTSLGTFSGISVTITDSVGGTVTKTFSIVVTLNNNPITLTVTDFTTKVGHPISTKQPTWSNNVGNTTLWADQIVTDNALSIDSATGIITGTATALMDITPNIHITDPTDRVTSKPIRIQVIPDTVINAPDTISATVNTAMAAVTATGSNTIAPAVWTLAGTLPTGMIFTASTGRFSGTPTEMGTFDVVLTNTDSVGDGQQKTIQIVVMNNGAPPTIALTPTAAGYVVTTAATITPTYTNRKTGDVVDLAPGSGALPPGMSIAKNASGVYVITKTVQTASEIGVYRGVNLRVTDTEGLHSETGSLDFIYRPATYLAYPAVSFATRADAPVSIAAPTPSAGQAIEDVTFEFSTKAAGGQNLTIDPDTGAIGGYVTASGVNIVRVTEGYDGKTIRTFTYNATYTVNALTLTAAEPMAVFSGNSTTQRLFDLENDLAGGGVAVDGLPAGMTFTADGKVTGSSSEIGVYPVTMSYSDAYGSATASTVIDIRDGDAAGHRYWKFTYASNSSVRPILYDEFDIYDANGRNMVWAASSISGNANIYDDDKETTHQVSTSAGTLALTYDRPISMSSIKLTMRYGSSTTYQRSVWSVSWSDDNVNWTIAGQNTGGAGTDVSFPLTN
jgi:hypothetical protein